MTKVHGAEWLKWLCCLTAAGLDFLATFGPHGFYHHHYHPSNSALYDYQRASYAHNSPTKSLESIMAKSTRSKVKRSFRAKKREDSAYAANEAARLQRLSAKLAAVASKNATEEEEVPLMDQTEDGEEERALSEGHTASEEQDTGSMEVDGASQSKADSKRISTHGPRGSRRDEWRKSKGLPVRPKSTAVNKHGVPVSRRQAGRVRRGRL